MVSFFPAFIFFFSFLSFYTRFYSLYYFFLTFYDSCERAVWGQFESFYDFLFYFIYTSLIPNVYSFLESFWVFSNFFVHVLLVTYLTHHSNSFKLSLLVSFSFKIFTVFSPRDENEVCFFLLLFPILVGNHLS